MTMRQTTPHQQVICHAGTMPTGQGLLTTMA